jgi:protein TonB
MFDDALLDSSPAHTLAFRPAHWLLILSAGVAGFTAAFLLIPLIFGQFEPRGLTLQSAILGTATMFYTLMLCYVRAEARRLRLRAWLWLGLVLALNFVGFFTFLVRSAMKTGEWKRAAIPAAYVLEATLVSALVLAPLIHTQALSRFEWGTRWLAPPLPPPPPSGRGAPAHPRTTPRRTAPSLLEVPPVIPPHVVTLNEEPTPQGIADPGGTIGVPYGWPEGSPVGVIGSPFSGPSTPPPPAPLARREQKNVRIRVGGQVEAARIIFQPRPDYPKLAQIARAQGTVRLEAIIDKDGTIKNLRVLSGPPLLVRAAVEAVTRWRYQPTLLNGEPVEVITDIDVNFALTD